MLKFSNLYTYTTVLSLFGYGLIPIILPGTSAIYRVVILTLSIFVIVIKTTGILRISSSNSRNQRHKTQYFPPNISLRIVLIFSFIVLYSIRLVHDAFVNPYELFMETNYYLLFWFAICLFPGFVFLFNNSSQKSKNIFFCFIFTLFISLYSLRSIGSSFSTERFGGRLSIEGLNPISLGSYAGTLIITCVILLLTSSKSENYQKLKQLSYWFGIVVGGISLIFTASRGPVISLIVTLIFISYLFISKRGLSINKYKIRLFLLLLFCFFIFSYLIQSSQNLDSQFMERIGNLFDAIFSGGDVSSLSEGRLYRVNDALSLISDNYLLGYGLELPRQSGYPHNLIIESFLATGLFGGSVFTGLFAFSLVKAARLISVNGHRVEIFSYLYIQYAINALFSGALYASNIFWYLLFYVLSSKYYKNKIN